MSQVMETIQIHTTESNNLIRQDRLKIKIKL